MLTILIQGLFAFGALFALAAICLSSRRHAGAWDALAAERQALRRRDRLAAGEIERLARLEQGRATSAAEVCVAMSRGGLAGRSFTRTVSTRHCAEAAGPVVYARRFNGRSESAPLRLALRAA